MIQDLPLRVIKEAVARALAEDVGGGDVTTSATVEAGARCRAQILAKASGVIAGLALARATFAALDPGISFQALVGDGQRVEPGTVVARLAGRTQAILTGERTALNFLQRMSGIATMTAQYVEAVRGTKAAILDTRKTAPGLRLLDKYAVRAGGGRNHRTGLFDGVLIKDNHIRAAGGLGEAVRRARAAAHPLLTIEVEAQTLEQVGEAAAAGAEIIMLDNMSVQRVREALILIAGQSRTEVSGRVTLETVRAYAEAGVDYISVGALTHSATALDLSLEISEEQVPPDGVLA
jgi:nicotinate-nucleotide pyrophosphorylase (carboxylating)